MKQITYKKIPLHSPLSMEECFAALDRNLIGIDPDESSSWDPEGFAFGGYIYTDNTFFIRRLVPGRGRKGHRQVITGSITETAAGSEIEVSFGFPFLGFLLLAVFLGIFLIAGCVTLYQIFISGKYGDRDILNMPLFTAFFFFIFYWTSVSEYKSNRKTLAMLFDAYDKN